MGGLAFRLARTVATIVAMISNYWQKNFLTYRDRRRRGSRFIAGLWSLYPSCRFAVVANVGAAYLVP